MYPPSFSAVSSISIQFPAFSPGNPHFFSSAAPACTQPHSSAPLPAAAWSIRGCSSGFEGGASAPHPTGGTQPCYPYVPRHPHYLVLTAEFYLQQPSSDKRAHPFCRAPHDRFTILAPDMVPSLLHSFIRGPCFPQSFHHQVLLCRRIPIRIFLGHLNGSVNPCFEILRVLP